MFVAWFFLFVVGVIAPACAAAPTVEDRRARLGDG
jgi:hypothetical protein